MCKYISSMTYNESIRKAMLKYRRKNRETIAPKVAEQVSRHRLKWKSYTDEIRRLNKIGKVF
jgi:hypothetical protein